MNGHLLRDVPRGKGRGGKSRSPAGHWPRSTGSRQARHAAAVPGARRRAAEPEQLPPPRLDARRRGVRDRKPARIYDLRSMFASNALAAGVTVFELAKVMGTSVAMIERHYGTLIGGAHGRDRGRLDALETQFAEQASDV